MSKNCDVGQNSINCQNMSEKFNKPWEKFNKPWEIFNNVSEKFDKRLEKNSMNRRKNSISSCMNCFDEDVKKLFRQGGSFV